MGLAQLQLPPEGAIDLPCALLGSEGTVGLPLEGIRASLRRRSDGYDLGGAGLVAVQAEALELAQLQADEWQLALGVQVRGMPGAGTACGRWHQCTLEERA